MSARWLLLGALAVAGCATTQTPLPLADADAGQRAWAAACADNAANASARLVRRLAAERAGGR